MINEVPEFHQVGMVDILNLAEVQAEDLQEADCGLQVHRDGRIWLCVNGLALIRFKPQRRRPL